MNQQKGRRGFAAMDAEKQRAIASKGGKAAHQKGTAHQFTSEEAREAGRKGGQAQARKSQERSRLETGVPAAQPQEEEKFIPNDWNVVEPQQEEPLRRHG